jgi:DNA-binding MarR family transcriptional regulator
MTVRNMSRKAAKPSEAEVADRIHSAAIRLLRGLRRQDDKWGLSAPRLSALSVVVFAGPITLGDLARAEQVRPPTMTRLVQALEEDRLVTRKPDAGDKRVAWIKATARGRRLLLRGRKARVRALAASLRSLDQSSVDTLDRAASLLDTVARRL